MFNYSCNVTKTRASACHGNVKQPPPFSSSLVCFTSPSPEPPPAHAHSSFLIENEFFHHFPESSNNLYPAHDPSDTVFPSYTARTLTPYETRDLINHPINVQVLLFISAFRFLWGMSRHVRNDQPRHSGPQECGLVALGSQSDRSSLHSLLVAFPVATPQNLVA